VKMLRNAGFLISSITEDSPGIDDSTVLAKAKTNSQIILTFDSDYGELIFKNKLPTPAGVVYFRFLPAHPGEAAKILLHILSLRHINLQQNFTIVQRNKIRQRPLP